MSDIYWTGYQEAHITERHGVSAEEFEEAWADREEVLELEHPEHGPYWESLGFTDAGRLLEMIWRWQGDAVWPITAYFVEEEDHGDQA